MSDMRKRIVLSLLVLSAAGSTLSHAQDWQRDFGLTVLNEARLSDQATRTLRGVLSSLPRALYEHVECISIDAPPTCSSIGLRGPNIFAGGSGIASNPFPPDIPAVIVDQFYEVLAHELAHQIDVVLYAERGFGPGWARRLTDEAGCPQANYLRSQLPPCYFAQNPQEFIASICNQYCSDSKATLQLGLKRFDTGNPHPLNQAVFYLALMGTTQPWSQTGWESDYGTVFAYEYQGGIPKVTLWQVFPWRCPGHSQITGPDFSLGFTTDEHCHVTAVTHREGI